jgi:hypothetical protein
MQRQPNVTRCEKAAAESTLCKRASTALGLFN